MVPQIKKWILDGDRTELRKLTSNDEPKATDLIDIVKLSKNKGVEMIKAIIINRFPNAIKYYREEEKQNLVVKLISEISEDIYCAGWYDGIEFDLWSWINNEETISKNLNHRIVKEDLIELNNLSSQIRHWAMWSDEEKEIPVKLSEWKKIFKMKKS